MNYQKVKTIESTTMKTQSDDFAIPEPPAPGENVYPIYSHGAICGYIYSGGNEKTHKIFLNGETNSVEEKPPKRKRFALMSKSCYGKMPKTTNGKSTKTPTDKQKSKPEKLLSNGEICLPSNKSNIELNLSSENTPETLNVTSEIHSELSPLAAHTNTDVMNSKRNDNAITKSSISLPVFTSPLTNFTSNQNILFIKNPDSQLESPVIMRATSLIPSAITNVAKQTVSSSNITPSINDKVIFSSSLNTTCQQPIILAPNNSNSTLQSNWLTSSGQPTWPNTLSYVLMPPNQSSVYLTESANMLPNLLPTTATASSTVDSFVALPSTSTATPTTPVTTMTTQVAAPTNQLLPQKTILSKNTFVQVPIQLPSQAKEKINILNPNQNFSQSTKALEKLKQTKKNSGNEKDTPEIPLLVNNNSEKIVDSQSLKHDVTQSNVNSFSTCEKASNDPSSFHLQTESNETTEEFTEIGQEKTVNSDLAVDSTQVVKLPTPAPIVLSFIENSNIVYASSSSEKTKVFLTDPAKKRPRGRPKKSQELPKIERKQIPILPATEGITALSNSPGFNLLPSGNFVICFQKETNNKDILGNNCEEQAATPLHLKMDKQLPREEKSLNKEKLKEKRQPLLDENKNMHDLANQDEIVIKTEPFDDDDLSVIQVDNLSAQCMASISPIPENVSIQEQENSKNESSHAIQDKEEENELVISSCFSLSINTESLKKSLPINSDNLDFDNLFFLPCKNSDNQTLENPDFTKEENSKNISNQRKLPEPSIKTEPLDLSSDSPASNENQTLCRKSLENNQTFCGTSTKEHKSSTKTLDCSLDVSKSQATGIKGSQEASNKSILDQECLKNLKKEDLIVDKTKISVVPLEPNKSPPKPKSNCLLIPEELLSIPGPMKNSFMSDKNFVGLKSTDETLITNLTKDEDADSFLESCIAFHQQQLYLLNLQIEQHKTVLEKLKKVQKTPRHLMNNLNKNE